jgi:hypothetical protein
MHNSDTPSPIAAKRATMHFLVGQELGSVCAYAEPTFLNPLLTRVEDPSTTVFSATELT